ncbi:Smr/MutS family protein [Phenylobacterium sp.]|uniref:Smr/MutS family protein n=1 Tax=Phenylobacterium sp. TaxID=1871053 RepID=UPI00120D4D26|nr:Smr/MutS family protein [Phenylobacterium sp.]THD63744.1 MAG: DNA mismatch repair protein MutS [Phenylobacterium sp.]
MKRPLKPEERHIWGVVSATVHPLPGRGTPTPSQEAARTETAARIAPPRPATRPGKIREQLDGIEPNRRHRIAREREDIGARLDLHGMDQVRARAVLEGFLATAFHEGWRAVLVITGKGVQGDGVLKRRAPEWLAAPHLAHIVAGISDAARHHGGEGALYVALKRKPRG